MAIIDKDTQDLAEEYAEIGAEELVEQASKFLPALGELSSDIPYVKTLVAAIKLPRTFSDFLLGKKVYAFLYSSKISEEKMQKFKQNFSKVKQERLWERVTLSLNSHDDKQKSEIIGKLFAALIDDVIDEKEFFAMVHATNSMNMFTLVTLKEMYSMAYEYILDSTQLYSFIPLGLIGVDNSTNGTWGDTGPYYPLTQRGWKYTGIAFDYPDAVINGYSIGEGELIAVLDNDGRPTNKAYPLGYINEKGYRYKEVDLFSLNTDGKILCNEATGLPKLIGSCVVASGEAPETAAGRLIAGRANGFLNAVTRNMEDSKAQKWSYFIKNDDQPENCTHLDINESRAILVNEPNKTDETRYYVALIDGINAYFEDSANESWDSLT